jgi:hypothetical protein
LSLREEYEERHYSFITQDRLLKDKIHQILESIKGILDLWEQKYLITSPIKGRVSFLDNWNKNQYIASGTPLFTIIPEDNEYVANIFVSENGFGKVEKGQTTRIKLNNYPFERYGFLVGKVKDKSLVPVNGFYRIRVKLNNKTLTTNYNNNISYTPEMSGTAEIITKDLRLFERLTTDLRKLLDNNY